MIAALPSSMLPLEYLGPVGYVITSNSNLWGLTGSNTGATDDPIWILVPSWDGKSVHDALVEDMTRLGDKVRAYRDALRDRMRAAWSIRLPPPLPPDPPPPRPAWTVTLRRFA